MGMLETMMAEHLEGLRLRYGADWDKIPEEEVESIRTQFLAGVLSALAAIGGDDDETPDAHVLMNYQTLSDEVGEWIAGEMEPDRDGSGLSSR
jgi:hypothetical protein